MKTFVRLGVVVILFVPCAAVGADQCHLLDFTPKSSSIHLATGCFDANFIAEMRDEHALNLEKWDEGWGYRNGVSSGDKTPFCLLIETLDILHRTRGPAIVEGAGEYVALGGGISPSCVDDGRNAEAPAGSSVANWILGTPPGIDVHLEFFDRHVASRAASLVHEARHIEGRVPHGNNDCPSGQGRSWPDLRCDDFYGDTGAYTRQVDYLRGVIAAPEDAPEILARVNMTLAEKLEAAKVANGILEKKFRQDGGFRIHSLSYSDRKRAFVEPVDPRLIHNATCGRDLCEMSLAQGTQLTSCFLSRVQGEFNGYEDSVYLSYQQRTWNSVLGVYGNYLIAESNSDRDNNGNVAADARCVPKQQSEYQVRKATGVSERTASLGAAAGRTCYLRGVAGRLDNDSEFVGVAVEEGEWIARVRGSDGGGMEGLFGCISTSASTLYSARDNQVVEGPSVSLVIEEPGTTPLLGNTCALTSVYGDFAGHDEYVKVGVSQGNVALPSIGSKWTLSVHDGREASSGSVGGSMVCFDL